MVEKKPLEELLSEMDAYDWDSVPDIYDIEDTYSKGRGKLFEEQLEDIDIKLKGSVLDVCSGRVSLASVHKDTVAFDYPYEMIKVLREKGVRAVKGDIFEGLPFEENSFDYSVTIGPPMRTYYIDNPDEREFEKKYKTMDIGDVYSYVDLLVDEMVSVAREKAVVISLPVVRYLPKRHRDLISDMSWYYVVYDLKKGKRFKDKIDSFLEFFRKDYVNVKD